MSLPLSRRSIYPLLALVIAVLIAFSPALSAGFSTFDDQIWIGANPALAPGATLRDVLRMLTGPFEHLYSPLTHLLWLALATAGRLAGHPGAEPLALDAALFHGTNLLIHLLASLVVLRLLRELFPSAAPAARLIGAALFALHPVQVETVAWVSGLKDLLCGLLMATALLAHARDQSRPTPGRAGLTLVATLLALFAKPTAVMLPLMLGAVSLLYPRSCDGDRDGAPSPTVPMRRRLLAPLAALLLAAPFLYLTTRWQGSGTVHTVAGHLRPLVALDALGHYIRQILFPVGFTLDYGRSMAYTVADGHWVLNAVILLAATVAILISRNRGLWLGGILFLLPLLPVSGLRDFDFASMSVVTDHYAYPAMIGAAVVAARVAEWVCRRVSVRAHAPALLAVLVGLAIPTYRTASHWKFDANLYVHGLSVNPRSALLHAQYAALLMRDNRFGESFFHARQALATWPEYPQAHYMAAAALVALEKPQEAIPHYRAALASPANARNPLIHAALADAYAAADHLEEARQSYRKALTLNPKDPTATRMLPLVEAELARRAAATRPTTTTSRSTPPASPTPSPGTP